jgi:serine/threonine-protein kinase
MAAVWRAHNDLLDVDVAIKFIRADLAHPGLTSRLLQEARAAARIEHPAIVRVTDFGKTRVGDPYIVMELLRGDDLGKVLRERKRMQAVDAVQTLLPIANALVVAHAKGIVHRDLKPDNVFLAEKDGGRIQPKLVDFGIAKLEKPNEARLTQAGAAMGSPAYMAPEQARGKDVDSRADVWSFSVMLYECIAGQLPFDGATQAALVCAILEAKPAPLTDALGGDAALWAIIERGLRKEPEDRWQSMQEMGGALARWLMARDAKSDIAGNSLISTWSEYAQPAQSIRTGNREFSDADAEGRTAVATQLSFHNKSAGTSGAPARSRSLVIGGVAFAVSALIAVPALFFLLNRGGDAPGSGAAGSAEVASSETAAAVTAEPAPPASAPPAATVAPPPDVSAAPPPSASAAEPKPTLPKVAAVRTPQPKATQKPAAAPKPAAPTPAPKPQAPKPTPGELEIKTTL